MTDIITTSSQEWEHRVMRQPILEAIDQIIENDDFSEYGVVRDLEKEFAEWLGVSEAVAVNSGTSAIFLALKAAGIGPGDEVVIAPNTCHSVTSGLGHVGADFQFVDIDPDTFNMDPSLVEAAITEKTKAIFVVHMYGHPADMDPLMAVAEKHDLMLFEDPALATGARYKGKRVGSIAPVGIFSFGPHKLVSAVGGAGMITTDDGELADAIRLIRAYGVPLDFINEGEVVNGIRLRDNMDHVSEAYNLKMDSIQAATVRLKLPKTEEWMKHRQSVAERYHEAFKDLPVDRPLAAPDVEHAYRLYVLCLENRDDARVHLAKQGIGTGILYSPPLHLQTIYRDLGWDEGSFPMAEDRAARLMTIPIFNGMTDEQVDRVIKAVRSYFGK